MTEQNIDELAENVKSGKLFGRINWAYVFGKGKSDKMMIWKYIFALIKFIIRWLLLPAVVAVSYYLNYLTIAKYTLIGWDLAEGK